MNMICKNGTKKTILLIVEPWAEEYLLEPGQSVEVIGEGGGADGVFEVEYFDGGLIVYGWEGSVLSIFKNGVEVSPSLQS